MNTKLTFVTGNSNKAEQLQKWLDLPVTHQKLDLDEIQSVDVMEIAERKARQAYSVIGTPVLVEDVELVFNVIQPLPGPLIKWFQVCGHEKLCRMLDGFADRSAYARVVYALYDGQQLRMFDGRIDGTIADQPRGEGGFGYDRIFVANGFSQTRAELNDEQYAATSPRKQAIESLKAYLLSEAKAT